MKNKLQFKKAVFLWVVSSLFVLNSYAQDSYIKNRWNIKTGYARYTNGVRLNDKVLTNGNYRLEVNYGVSNNIEAGIFGGYSKFDANSLPSISGYSAAFYGINCNLHLLPFLIKEDDFRFDLYITGKLGGFYLSSPSNHFSHGNNAEYGLGAGISFYLYKHLGVYAEYCFGKYYFKDDTKLRYGLTLKF